MQLRVVDFHPRLHMLVGKVLNSFTICMDTFTLFIFPGQPSAHHIFNVPMYAHTYIDPQEKVPPVEWHRT